MRSESIKTAAGELAGTLATARQVAVTQNRTVCVEHDGSKLWFRLAPLGTTTCGTEIFKGPITDQNGFVRLTNAAMTITGPSSLRFSGFGATQAGGLYTVRNTVDGATMNVRISVVGNARIGN
jgi:Tfp pilus assembly protein FimT